MNLLSPASQSFVDAFSPLKGELPWLSSLKKSGMDGFSDLGLPTLRNESWRYTNLKSLGDFNWNKAAKDCDVGDLSWLSQNNTHRVVMVNGKFNHDLSELGDLPDGVFIGSLKEALNSHGEILKAYLGKVAVSKDSPLISLNTANMADGYVILLEDAQLMNTIEILNLGRPNEKAIAYHPRNLVVCEKQSQAKMVEYFSGPNEGVCFANSVAEIFVDQGSQMEHHRLFADGYEAFGITSTCVKVGGDAIYNNFNLSDNGKLLRNDIHIHLVAPGASTKVGGVYMASDEQLVDNTIMIEHEEVHTKSQQLFKGALDGKARGVFQGNIKVHEGADGADGQLTNKTLLLSPGTEVDGKPQLEIYADDVKCAHGFAAGELDKEELFYLRSRGIPYAQARLILIESFLSEVISEFDLGEYAMNFSERISQWMQEN